MMSFSRSTQALFWITRLVRLSPLVRTAPLRTNFSPGFNESLSGMGLSPRHFLSSQRDLRRHWLIIHCRLRDGWTRAVHTNLGLLGPFYAQSDAGIFACCKR